MTLRTTPIPCGGGGKSVELPLPPLTVTVVPDQMSVWLGDPTDLVVDLRERRRKRGPKVAADPPTIPRHGSMTVQIATSLKKETSANRVGCSKSSHCLHASMKEIWCQGSALDIRYADDHGDASPIKSSASYVQVWNCINAQNANTHQSRS